MRPIYKEEFPGIYIRIIGTSLTNPIPENHPQRKELEFKEPSLIIKYPSILNEKREKE